ncbi:MAG: hypothetical protein HY288_12790 [Planctomycetia bacterium]|nr:hypothetical protein [Planctomycetia bacterium]
MRIIFRTLSLALTIAILGHSALASVLYSNLGPGDTYFQSSGLTVDGVLNVAGGFVSLATGQLSEIELAVGDTTTTPTPQKQATLRWPATAAACPGQSSKTSALS